MMLQNQEATIAQLQQQNSNKAEMMEMFKAAMEAAKKQQQPIIVHQPAPRRGCFLDGSCVYVKEKQELKIKKIEDL